MLLANTSPEARPGLSIVSVWLLPALQGPSPAPGGYAPTESPKRFPSHPLCQA